MLSQGESPEYVQTSLAGAICLGLESGRFMEKTKCTCLNLLLTYKNGCSASCSYCGLAHNRQVDAAKTFIRVKWPTYSMTEILDRVKNRPHPFKRVCVSMITQGRAMADTCTIVKQVRQETNLPVSALVAPTIMKGLDDMRALKAAGTERIGVAIDAATEKLFDQHRGKTAGGPHRWERFWECLAEAVEVFGEYNVGVHLIVGLGETEEEMVKIIDKAYKMGALTHLFSFFPEAGSRMEDFLQPPLGQYRRIQMARYLINEGIIDASNITFGEAGRITDYGTDIEPYINRGVPFMTSGCPGENGLTACNRPFGNERASEPMRNYPYLPEAEDIKIIRPQIWTGVK
ncbi:MAG: radical SAM protein [Syntrophomonadaceae bacterium]|jgi:biotin synthase-related radical SAM superfamily protein